MLLSNIRKSLCVYRELTGIEDSNDEESNFEGFTNAEIFVTPGNVAADYDSGSEMEDLVVYSDAHLMHWYRWAQFIRQRGRLYITNQRAWRVAAAAQQAEGEDITCGHEIPHHPNGDDSELQPVTE